MITALRKRQVRTDDFALVYPAGRGPAEVEKRRLSARSAALERMLDDRLSGDDPDVAEIWERLDGLRGRRLDDREKALDLDNLMVAMSGACRPAVTEALTRILQARAGLDPRFPPNAAQLRALADVIEREWTSEDRQIAAVLAVPETVPQIAHELSPDQKAALDAKVATITRRVAERGRSATRTARPDPESVSAENREAFERLAAQSRGKQAARKRGEGLPLPSMNT